MPTARELLEQADALMRRNRARDEAPPPVEVVPEPVTVVPEPVTVSPATVTEPSTTVAAAPAFDDDIPELMEVAPLAPVDDGGPPLRQALARDLETPPSEDYPRPPYAALETSLDDIPELTEIVEEIEAPSMLDPAGDFDLGEPSVWMEPGHGEVSILGPWPEPPVSEVDERGSASAGDRQSSVPGYDDDFAGTEEVGILHVVPELFDEDFVDELPIDSTMAAGAPALADDAVAAEHAVPASLPEPTVESPAERVAAEGIAGTNAEPEAIVGGDATVEAEAEAVADATPEAEAATVDDATEAETEAVADAMPEAEAEAVADAMPEAEAAAETKVEAPPSATPTESGESGIQVAPIEFPHSLATDVVPAEPAGDDERWAMLAEEVRMQVLQRIDIFTDTGLQEQLAVRLQPIVDRASTEFVAAINQHVGQLLRAYVAEAIEREIEKWRAGDR